MLPLVEPEPLLPEELELVPLELEDELPLLELLALLELALLDALAVLPPLLVLAVEVVPVVPLLELLTGVSPLPEQPQSPAAASAATVHRPLITPIPRSPHKCGVRSLERQAAHRRRDQPPRSTITSSTQPSRFPKVRVTVPVDQFARSPLAVLATGTPSISSA